MVAARACVRIAGVPGGGGIVFGSWRLGKEEIISYGFFFLLSPLGRKDFWLRPISEELKG
jgi:hypothetical protein